jgi:F-type H+-transporting ATPase subunit epsilon
MSATATTTDRPHRALTSDHGGKLDVIVVTPEATVREVSAEFIALPLFDGEIGIAPGHSPMIGRMGYGEMRIVVGGEIERFYVDGGFVQVVDNLVSVLTNRAVPSGSLNVQAATEQLAAAHKRPANTPELAAIRNRLELQARAQIHTAKRAK